MVLRRGSARTSYRLGRRWDPFGLQRAALDAPAAFPRRGPGSRRTEILGDVFAWNKVCRTSFRLATGLPGGRGPLRGRPRRLAPAWLVRSWCRRCLPRRISTAASSVVGVGRRPAGPLGDQADVAGLRSRPRRRPGFAVFIDRVLAGDLWRYFWTRSRRRWWRLLRAGVLELWGDRSLVHSAPPVHRLCGSLVEQDRRDDAATLMAYVADLGGTATAGAGPASGAWRLDVPTTGSTSAT